jgi:hypothetical protein
VNTITVDSHEERIPAERFPNVGFDLKRGGSAIKQVIRYHIPLSGNEELLRYAPSSGLMWSTDVFVNGDSLCFDVIDFYGDPERIKREADQILKLIGQQAANVTREIDQYNNGLRAAVSQILQARREQVQKQHQVLSSLGVPIRKSVNIPETFVVPSVRKKVITKPQTPPPPKERVPTVEPEIYDDILRTVHEMGKVFERYPSTYRGKDEEALRDHLILQLEPRFEDSTTGETFNKNGKTDILIRYEKKNIFVAECKFWAGKTQHLKTIDQILSYLTWRDSKTAVVYFVKRKDMSAVLGEITAQTPLHSNFVCVHNKGSDPSWQRFEFHLPGDPGSKIQMAILAFHIPA